MGPWLLACAVFPGGCRCVWAQSWASQVQTWALPVGHELPSLSVRGTMSTASPLDREGFRRWSTHQVQ